MYLLVLFVLMTLFVCTALDVFMVVVCVCLLGKQPRLQCPRHRSMTMVDNELNRERHIEEARAAAAEAARIERERREEREMAEFERKRDKIKPVSFSVKPASKKVSMLAVACVFVYVFGVHVLSFCWLLSYVTGGYV